VHVVRLIDGERVYSRHERLTRAEAERLRDAERMGPGDCYVEIEETPNPKEGP
jgi:hypothetical protein